MNGPIGAARAVAGAGWVLTLLGLGCGEAPREGRAAGWDDPASRINGYPTFLAFRTRSLDSLVTGCPPAPRTGAGEAVPADLCARASLGWVVFPDAPDGLQDRLHARILELLGAPLEDLPPALTAYTVQEGAARVAHAFLEGYREAEVEGGGGDGRGPPWSLHRRIRVAAASPSLLTLAVAEHRFEGGAHPVESLRYHTLDPTDGRPLGLSDFFVPDFQAPLAKAAEAAFRAARGIGADQDLDSAGFRFPGNRFAPGGNVLPTAEGLAFRFDPYEVAPYALGPTDFTVPWDRLRPLLRRAGPLAEFLR